MASYIGKVQIGDGDQYLIGSTLYGICANDAANSTSKTVTLPNFDNFMDGVTVYVKFVNGNSATANVVLKVGNTAAIPVEGNFVCSANDIIGFTLERDSVDSTRLTWRSNHNIKIEQDNNNIITKIAGQDVNIATKAYVDSAIAGISGLSGAMRFIGTTNTPIVTGTERPVIDGNTIIPAAGDVIIVSTQGNDARQEYVWDGSKWQLLGDEGSYALKSKTIDISQVISFDRGSLPTLGQSVTAHEITGWDDGSPAEASVTNGILSLTNGTSPVLSTTGHTIPIIDTVGSLPTLSVTSTSVVIP